MSVREPSIRFESLLVTLLGRELQDSQSPCLSETLQVGRHTPSVFVCSSVAGPVLTGTASPAEIPVVELDLSVKNGVVIRAGETLRLPATVTGKPYPSITWTINDGKPDKERVEILTEGNNSVVAIKSAQRRDCGKYHVSACNPSGTKGASTRVEVVGEYRSRGRGQRLAAASNEGT